MGGVTLPFYNQFIMEKFSKSNSQRFGLSYNFSESGAKVSKVWRWGNNNLFPRQLCDLSRRSTINRRIINDKADYITGQGFNCDPRQERLRSFIESCNGSCESLRWVISRVVFDKVLFGNAFMEIVTNSDHDYISFYHQDASQCRLSQDSSHVVMHHNWANFNKKDALVLPLFPNFERQIDGSYRSIVHYKEYEPMFTHYGVPKYVAALEAAVIAQKTDKWNVARLDNSFQPSGVMILDGQVETRNQAEEIAVEAQKKFSGKPGQVMFMVKNGIEGDSTKFVPLTSSSDGDWKQLHDQSTSDIIIAHSWFRTLSGIDYTTGFSAERIQYEYEIALNSIIQSEQQEIIEPLVIVLEDLLSLDCSTLCFINKPPFNAKPKYMYVWEARQADGLPYDRSDSYQQQFLSDI